MSAVNELLAVCAAGAVGTGLRYLIARWMLSSAGSGFPWGTLTVNVVGSAIGGALLSVALTSPHLSPAQRVVLTTGFLGGFTTYSAFNSETLAYLQNGSYGLAATYLMVTVVACLGAGALGLGAAALIAGR